LFKVNSNVYVVFTAVIVAFVIFGGGVVSSTANAQNSSSIKSNGLPTNGTAKTATVSQ